jgi:hypothetical protein
MTKQQTLTATKLWEISMLLLLTRVSVGEHKPTPRKLCLTGQKRPTAITNPDARTCSHAHFGWLRSQQAPSQRHIVAHTLDVTTTPYQAVNTASIQSSTLLIEDCLGSTCQYIIPSRLCNAIHNQAASTTNLPQHLPQQCRTRPAASQLHVMPCLLLSSVVGLALLRTLALFVAAAIIALFPLALV